MERRRTPRFVNAAFLKRFSRFGLVGGLGFVVDAGLTLTFIQAGLDAFSARFIAIMFAMLVTWRLNRAITFDDSGASQRTEGLRYGAVAITAAVINYAVYAALMLAFPGLFPVIAVAAATGISMAISYLGYSQYAFKKV